MSFERGCGKPRQPEREESEAVVCAYPWKFGQETPNTSGDEMHEEIVTGRRTTVYHLGA